MEYHVPLDPHRHLRAAARERAERTVARLEAGIRAVEGRRELVTARAIERETGLTFKTIQRNAAAYELYKAAAEAFRSGPNPSHRRRHRRSNVTTPPLRDSLLAYKKPQLANRLRGPEADRGTGDCVGGPDRRLPGAARANHHGHYRRRGAIGKCDEHPPTDPRRRPVAVSTVNVQRPASVNSGDFGVIRLMEAAWLRLGPAGGRCCGGARQQMGQTSRPATVDAVQGPLLDCPDSEIRAYGYTKQADRGTSHARQHSGRNEADEGEPPAQYVSIAHELGPREPRHRAHQA